MSLVRRSLLALGLLLAAAPAFAQNSDYNGSGYEPERSNYDTGVILTLSGSAAGTFSSPDQTNTTNRGVNCVFNQSSHTGTPSTTFSIQVKDTVSGGYVTVLTSAAITADATPAMLTVYGGAATVANVSDGRPLSRIWRVQAVVAGTTPVVTATVGCSSIR